MLKSLSHAFSLWPLSAMSIVLRRANFSFVLTTCSLNVLGRILFTTFTTFTIYTYSRQICWFFKTLFKGSVWSKKSFPFFAENKIIRSILNLWWHSEILKLILGVVRGMFTKRLKRTRRLLYTVKSDFFEMTALHSKC